MSQVSESEMEQREAVEFYIPGAALTSSLGRIETFLSERFELHGVVPIPTTYNQ
jgi:hypothetical protein